VIQKGDAKCPDSADMGTVSLLGPVGYGRPNHPHPFTPIIKVPYPQKIWLNALVDAVNFYPTLEETKMWEQINPQVHF
jgi:hypothetical protein